MITFAMIIACLFTAAVFYMGGLYQGEQLGRKAQNWEDRCKLRRWGLNDTVISK